jgi:hypothetical protein
MAAIALALVLAGCSGGSPTEPAGGGGGTLDLALDTAHFTLRYSTPARSLMTAYGEALEANWPRITADLAQPGLPRIEGLFHPDAAAFTAATGYHASGSVEGPSRFHVVALPYDATLPVHEFAHNVTLHLAPGVANDPVWLWEATAVYEAGQFVAPSSLPALVAGDFPALAELDRGAGGVSIYDVGFTIGEYIVERWGFDGLRRLLVARGDTLAALGVPFDQFERGWRDFVTARYL